MLPRCLSLEGLKSTVYIRFIYHTTAKLIYYYHQCNYMQKSINFESFDVMSRKEFVHDLAVEIVRVMMDVEIEPLGNGYTRAEPDKDVEKSYTLTFTLSGD